MPALSNRKKAALRKKRSAKGSFEKNDSLTNAIDQREDWETNELDMESLIQPSEEVEVSADSPKTIDQVLGKKTNQSLVSGQKRKGIYQKNSDVTKWRRRKEAEAIDSKQKLANFGVTITKSSEVKRSIDMSHTKAELIRIKDSVQSLDKYILPIMNKAKEGSLVHSYEYCQYLSVKLYFTKRLQGMNKGDSSRGAANYYWPNNNEKYRAATIVQWATQFIEEGSISEHQQGKNIKQQSFFNSS